MEFKTGSKVRHEKFGYGTVRLVKRRPSQMTGIMLVVFSGSNVPTDDGSNNDLKPVTMWFQTTTDKVFVVE